MGRISYGIYLLHYPLFTFWSSFINSGNFLPSNPVARNLLAFGCQILMATIAGSVSWHFFEEPMLRLKERFPSGSAMHSRTGRESRQQKFAEAH
jgi:peptidoglycan/LPS O-acetylase OafA/YrhL